MKHPYAADCAGGGYCTEKGMAEPGFCMCKERVERIKELEKALRSMRPLIAREIDRGGGIFSDKALDAIDAALAKRGD